MKHFLLSFVLLSASLMLSAQSGSGWEWASTAGTTASAPGNQVLDVTTDNSGNVYMIGRYYGAITIGGFSLPAPTGSDIFIAKYNTAGVIQWLKKHTPPTGYNEVGQVIVVDADGNIYIGGTDDTPTLSGRAFLAKYDNSGTMLWNKYLTLYEVGGINIAADGNLVVMESNGAARNILKLSKADGSTLWSVANTSAGSNGASTFRDFIDQSGNIYYTCFTTSAVTAVIAGQSITTTGLASFIASIDKDGNRRWVQTITNIQVQLGYTIDPDGNSYIIFSGGGGGTFQGYNTATNTNRYFELNNSGIVTKAALFSPYLAAKKMFRITADGVYAFIMQQATTSTISYAYGDYFYTLPATNTFALGHVAKYSRTTGALLWANSFEMNGSAYVSGDFNCIAVSPAGKVIVGGDYGTSVKFGGTAYTVSNPATYTTDLFIAQFDGNNVSGPSFTNWTGNAGNGSWTDAGNWSNGVADGNKKVNIPGGLSSYPTNIPANAASGKLEIAAGVTIKLPLAFSAPGGIINNGSIEIEEGVANNFFGTFANSTKVTGTGKLVFKNGNVAFYPLTPLEQSVEINSTATVSAYGGNILGDLILTNGILSSYGITVNGNVTGGSATSYIAGPLTRTVAANGMYSFPVGSTTRYAPVTLTLKNITGPQNITATFSNTINGSAPAVTVAGQTVSSLLNTGIWTVTPNVALTAGSYTITLNGRGFSNAVTDAARYVVLKRANSSSAWGFFGNNGTSSQTSTVVTATAGNITGFSDFAIGIASNAVLATLPVKLTRFTAIVENDATLLRWETSSELNNAAFVIERSTDAASFTTIGQVKGNGTTNLTSLYSFTDRQPQPGNNYYRLKQIDIDGRAEYSEVRVVKFNPATDVLVSIYPNPAAARITISATRQVISKITLVDISGHRVLEQRSPSSNVVLPASLTNGLYFVHILFADGSASQHKLQIKK
jgi:hypothetical protein